MNVKEKYINPFTDFGFKKLFGTEYNKELLIDFLNQVLGDREQIKDLTYLNTENQGKTETDRKAIFDLYCENERGEKFIIEVQNVRQEFFKDRSIFYSTFPIQSQAPKGQDWDYYLKAVYTIGILNFSFPDRSDQDRYVREVQLLDKHTLEIFYDRLTFIYLEMPRFQKKEEELETRFEKWLYVLNHLHRLQQQPKKLQDKIFKKLFKEAELAKLTPEEMRTYEESLKVYRDNYSVIETAKKEGRQEGASEKAVEMARGMKQEGLSVELIMRISGLTREQIAKL